MLRPAMFFRIRLADRVSGTARIREANRWSRDTPTEIVFYFQSTRWRISRLQRCDDGWMSWCGWQVIGDDKWIVRQRCQGHGAQHDGLVPIAEVGEASDSTGLLSACTTSTLTYGECRDKVYGWSKVEWHNVINCPYSRLILWLISRPNLKAAAYRRYPVNEHSARPQIQNPAAQKSRRRRRVGTPI